MRFKGVHKLVKIGGQNQVPSRKHPGFHAALAQRPKANAKAGHDITRRAQPQRAQGDLKACTWRPAADAMAQFFKEPKSMIDHHGQARMAKLVSGPSAHCQSRQGGYNIHHLLSNRFRHLCFTFRSLVVFFERTQLRCIRHVGNLAQEVCSTVCLSSTIKIHSRRHP